MAVWGPAAGILPAAPPCPDRPYAYEYRIGGVRPAWLATNLRSDYLVGPGTVTFSQTTESAVTAEVSGTAETEVGAIFAKAKASIGVSVAREWRKSSTWSYSAEVAPGQRQRLQQFAEARAFTVTKVGLVEPCARLDSMRTAAGRNGPLRPLREIVLWERPFVAPVENPAYSWELVY